MEKTVNEQFIKLSSKVPFPLPLELGNDVTVQIESQTYIFNCVKSEDRDNQDGSIDRIFTLKSTLE